MAALPLESARTTAGAPPNQKEKNKEQHGNQTQIHEGYEFQTKRTLTSHSSANRVVISWAAARILPHSMFLGLFFNIPHLSIFPIWKTQFPSAFPVKKKEFLAALALPSH